MKTAQLVVAHVIRMAVDTRELFGDEHPFFVELVELGVKLLKIYLMIGENAGMQEHGVSSIVS